MPDVLWSLRWLNASFEVGSEKLLSGPQKAISAAVEPTRKRDAPAESISRVAARAMVSHEMVGAADGGAQVFITECSG